MQNARAPRELARQKLAGVFGKGVAELPAAPDGCSGGAALEPARDVFIARRFSAEAFPLGRPGIADNARDAVLLACQAAAQLSRGEHFLVTWSARPA
jgi:hypothetical protein